MKKTLLIIFSFAGMLSSPALIAQSEQQSFLTSNYYAGIQIGRGTYDEVGFDEFNPSFLGGRFGMRVNNNLSIEGRLATGLDDDSISSGATTITADFDLLSGIYGVAHIDVTEALSVYGLAGYTYVEWVAKGEAPGISVSNSSDDSGLSIGFGAELDLNENLAMDLEYTQYLDESDYDITAISLGVVFGF